MEAAKNFALADAGRLRERAKSDALGIMSVDVLEHPLNPYLRLVPFLVETYSRNLAKVLIENLPNCIHLPLHGELEAGRFYAIEPVR
jgi:hypothetical protein